MGHYSPIIVGGNGHSGTRVFAEILTRGGVFTGIHRITKRRDSEDLRIIGLLTKWVRPYVYGTLDSGEMERMRRSFQRRLRLYFPHRRHPWGFKNPRTMLLLPFLNEMFPGMKFIHVVRDGRDISLGNEFVAANPYVDAYLDAEEMALPAEEKMILFWGRSNELAAQYASAHMAGCYLRMRWEELCRNPGPMTGKILEFAGCQPEDASRIAAVVKTPGSIGRWTRHTADEQFRVSE